MGFLGGLFEGITGTDLSELGLSRGDKSTADYGRLMGQAFNEFKGYAQEEGNNQSSHISGRSDEDCEYYIQREDLLGHRYRDSSGGKHHWCLNDQHAKIFTTRQQAEKYLRIHNFPADCFIACRIKGFKY